MSKRVTYLLIAAAAAATLVVASSAANASPAASASKAAKPRVVTIAMRDPGCHWFVVGGQYKAKLVVHGKTAFLNKDEDAVVFKGKGFVKRVEVGKTLAVTRGVYHITMVGQHPDDNNLLLVVK